MLQAQARVEEQAVQLHEKLEAKRAAAHAEKVPLQLTYAWLQSKVHCAVVFMHPDMSE